MNGYHKSKPTCFVLMPFKEPFNQYYEKIIKPAIEQAEMYPLRADEIYGVRSIMDDILTEIKSAAVIVAELTERNPNVLYETGLCHAFEKQVIMISQTEDDIPCDLRNRRYIIYNLPRRHFVVGFYNILI